MAQYRKKPVVIEATQFMGVGAPVSAPEGVCFCVDGKQTIDDTSPHAHVHTLEGPLKASVGDWIITGVKGERYPCKPDIFAATYEPVQ